MEKLVLEEFCQYLTFCDASLIQSLHNVFIAVALRERTGICVDNSVRDLCLFRLGPFYRPYILTLNTFHPNRLLRRGYLNLYVAPSHSDGTSSHVLVDHPFHQTQRCARVGTNLGGSSKPLSRIS